MSDIVDAIKVALATTEPFLVHGNVVYKKFNRIEINPVMEVPPTKFFGLFQESPEKEEYKGVSVELYYGDTLVKRIVFNRLDFANGDKLQIAGKIGGLVEFGITENN